MSGGAQVEAVKAGSRHLRGDLATELDDGADHFSAEGVTVLKFHGIYQQDDRDVRRERTARRLPLAYSCMVRAAVPGGVLPAEQWLAVDRVADEVGDGSLRLTTRQGVQYHFVAKDGLRPLIGALNRNLVTTLAACGDVVRNTMGCPAVLPGRAVLGATAAAIAERFRPRTRAYWELWVDGERAVTAEAGPDPDHSDEDEDEPIYGDTYLPRKFKIGLAWPGDNCVDVYSQDIGIVPTLAAGTTGEVTGFVVLAGGGLGMSHAREDDTYPRLATPVGWVEPDGLLDVCEAIVTTQRDHGNREDRQRARLKYLIDDRGEAWFRAEVERRLGRPLAGAPLLPPWATSDDHLGWHEQSDGRWTLGVPVESGRLRDGDSARPRAALRALVGAVVPEVRITPRQDLLLCGIAAVDRAEVEAVLRSHGVVLADQLGGVARHAMACPALPTCGQALAEAERALPGVVDDLTKATEAAGLAGIPLRVNMTGCPNGCARPYTAEIGVVGRTKRTYDLYVGGSAGGERLAERLIADVPLEHLPAALGPLLERYRAEAEPGEAFGDFCHRVGVATLATLVPEPERRRRRVAADGGEG